MRKVKLYLLISLLLVTAAEGCSTGHVISFNDHGTSGTGRTASNAPARPNLNIGQNARVAGEIIPWEGGGGNPPPLPTHSPTPTPTPLPIPTPTPRPAPKR